MKSMKFTIIALFTFLISCDSTNEVNANGLPELEGTWILSCQSDSFGEHTTQELILTNSTLELTTLYWDNSLCTGESIDMDESIGTYSIGSSFTSSSGLEVYEIDIFVSIGTQTVTFLDIVYLTSDQLNFGIYSLPNVRPTQINFNAIYNKQ